MSAISSHLISSHLISSHLISSHLISSHLISSHLISSHLISSHLISSHLISSHLISSHLISSHLISSHLISSHRIASHRIASHRIASQLSSAQLSSLLGVAWVAARSQALIKSFLMSHMTQELDATSDVIGEGPHFGIDVSRFRILSASPLGGPFGSTSPLSINPQTGKKYLSNFPQITPEDQVTSPSLNYYIYSTTQQIPASGSRGATFARKLYENPKFRPV
eukprot:g6608.t1